MAKKISEKDVKKIGYCQPSDNNGELREYMYVYL